MAEMFEKKHEKTHLKKRKRPLESVKIKMLKIGLRSDLSWPKVGLEPKFHDAGTFGGFGKRAQTDKRTRFMFYIYASRCSAARLRQKRAQFEQKETYRTTFWRV